MWWTTGVSWRSSSSASAGGVFITTCTTGCVPVWVQTRYGSQLCLNEPPSLTISPTVYTTERIISTYLLFGCWWPLTSVDECVSSFSPQLCASCDHVVSYHHVLYDRPYLFYHFITVVVGYTWFGHIWLIPSNKVCVCVCLQVGLVLPSWPPRENEKMNK